LFTRIGCFMMISQSLGRERNTTVELWPHQSEISSSLKQEAICFFPFSSSSCLVNVWLLISCCSFDVAVPSGPDRQTRSILEKLWSLWVSLFAGLRISSIGGWNAVFVLFYSLSWLSSSQWEAILSEAFHNSGLYLLILCWLTCLLKAPRRPREAKREINHICHRYSIPENSMLTVSLVECPRNDNR